MHNQAGKKEKRLLCKLVNTIHFRVHRGQSAEEVKNILMGSFSSSEQPLDNFKQVQATSSLSTFWDILCLDIVKILLFAAPATGLKTQNSSRIQPHRLFHSPNPTGYKKNKGQRSESFPVEIKLGCLLFHGLQQEGLMQLWFHHQRGFRLLQREQFMALELLKCRFWCAALHQDFLCPGNKFHPLRNGFTHQHLDLAPVPAPGNAASQRKLL